MFVLSQLHLAEVELQATEPQVSDRCLVIVLEDYEGYLFRKQNPIAPHCYVRKLNQDLAREAKQRFIDPLIRAIFSFTNTIFRNLEFSMFFKVIDIVDYILMLLPFAVEEFEDRTFSTIKDIQEEETISEKVRAEGFLNLNRIVARILLIKKSHYLSTENPIWATILSILNTEFAEGNFQEKFCYGILLVSVGESILESSDLSLASLFSKLSISKAVQSPQVTSGQSTAVIIRVLDILLSVVKMLNFNIAEVTDLIKENLLEVINSNDEVNPKVNLHLSRISLFSSHP